MEQRFVRDAVVPAPRCAKALHELHDFAAPSNTGGAFYSSHQTLLVKKIGDLRPKTLEVALENRGVLTRLPLALASFLAENVTAAGKLMPVHHLAVCAHLDALCGSPMGTNLRHWWLLLGWWPRRSSPCLCARTSVVPEGPREERGS